MGSNGISYHYVSFLLRSTPIMCIRLPETTENHMTASLTLTGSVAALSAALAAFERVDGEPDAGTRTVTPLTPTADAGNSLPVTQTASTDTGAGIPAPMPLPSAPSGVASTPIAPIPSTLPDSTDSEDEGEETDGSGVDAEGLPWDERIHSSSKKKTAKGVWAKRRGGPSGAELAAIEAELRGVTQVPMPTPAPVVPPMPVPVVPVGGVPEAAPIPAPMPAPPQPAPTPVAPPAPTPAPAPVAEEWDFAKLMMHIGPKMGSVITPEYLAQVVQRFGLNAITDAATKPEVIGQLVAQFQADNVW